MFYTDFEPRYNNSRELAGYDIVTDEDAIKNSLYNIFLINRGEVPGKPAFGNPLNMTLFDTFSFVTEKHLESAITDAVLKYEPRIRIENLTVTEAKEYNRIIIQIDYSYVIDDGIAYDSIDIPYSHNSISFLGGRIRPPETAERAAKCHFEK